MTNTTSSLIAATDGIEHLLERSLLSQVALNPRKAILTERVAERAMAIAGELGLPKVNKIRLELAALLHRVGEAHLPEDLRDKAYIEMTTAEMKVYGRYPLMSALHVNEQHPEIMDIVLKHREYVTGAGFPDRCQGEELPLEARILCVATEYEELMMYFGDSVDNEIVIQRRMLKNVSGRYDQQVVDALMASLVREAVAH